VVLVAVVLEDIVFHPGHIGVLRFLAGKAGVEVDEVHGRGGVSGEGLRVDVRAQAVHIVRGGKFHPDCVLNGAAILVAFCVITSDLAGQVVSWVF